MRAPARDGAACRLRRNTREFDAEGRVLRLKRYVSAVAGSAVLNAVLDALSVNTRVEVLYIQNFERGFTDAQLARLTQARPCEKRGAGRVRGRERPRSRRPGRRPDAAFRPAPARRRNARSLAATQRRVWARARAETRSTVARADAEACAVRAGAQTGPHLGGKCGREL